MLRSAAPGPARSRVDNAVRLACVCLCEGDERVEKDVSVVCDVV